MTSIRMLSLAALAVTPYVHAERPSEYEDSARFLSETALVLVPVTVTDHRGATVNGLRAQAFTVFEDRALRPIVSFSEQDESCSIGVVLDLSGSMKDKLTQARATLRAFFEHTDPGDEALLMTVSDRPTLEHGFTAEFGNMLDTALARRAGGSTALVDTVYVALAHMGRARNSRKALLVVSDGMDNHSHYSRGELMSAAVEADVQVYTVAIDDAPRYLKAIELEDRMRGVAFLSDLARKTGGVHYDVRDGSDIGNAVRSIERALRNQYVLGYRPATLDREGKWHAIRVKLDVPNTRVYTRRGYYSR